MAASKCDAFKAADLLVLDVRQLTGITDFFVLGTCSSQRQMASLAEELRLAAKHSGTPALSIEGLETALWVLIDLNDVVVHLFTSEARRYYDLEVLWGDAPRFDWQSD